MQYIRDGVGSSRLSARHVCNPHVLPGVATAVSGSRVRPQFVHRQLGQRTQQETIAGVVGGDGIHGENDDAVTRCLRAARTVTSVAKVSGK